MTLTPKQERFCQEYVVDHNGAAAAVRAGYAETSSRVSASKMLKQDNVKARVAELDAGIMSKLDVDAEMVVEGLLRAARDVDAAASSRVAAWAHLGKHLGMFTDRVEHSGESQVTEIRRVIVSKEKGE